MVALLFAPNGEILTNHKKNKEELLFASVFIFKGWGDGIYTGQLRPGK